MEHRLIQWSVGLVGLMGLLATALAGAMIWLLVTDPVAVSSATSTAEVGPLVRLVGTALFDALRQLLRYI